MSETPKHVYPKASMGSSSANVAPNPDFPQLEEDVLQYWDANDTFQQSIDENPSGENSDNEFVFFDGPPLRTACRTMATCSRGMRKTWCRGIRR